MSKNTPLHILVLFEEQMLNQEIHTNRQFRASSASPIPSTLTSSSYFVSSLFFLMDRNTSRELKQQKYA